MGLLLFCGYKASPWYYAARGRWMFVKGNAKHPQAKLRALYFTVVHGAGYILLDLL